MAIDVALEVLTDPDFLIDIDVLREGVGAYIDGLFQKGTDTTFSIKVSVQPATAEDFINAEEGERYGGSQVLYGRDQLNGAKNNIPADRIVNYLGEDWKVINSAPWGHHGFYKTLIVKVDQ